MPHENWGRSLVYKTALPPEFYGQTFAQLCLQKQNHCQTLENMGTSFQPNAVPPNVHEQTLRTERPFCADKMMSADVRSVKLLRYRLATDLAVELQHSHTIVWRQVEMT